MTTLFLGQKMTTLSWKESQTCPVMLSQHLTMEGVSVCLFVYISGFFPPACYPHFQGGSQAVLSNPYFSVCHNMHYRTFYHPVKFGEDWSYLV